MEIKSFAEQILFGSTLVDKLVHPGVTLTDLHRGSGINAPKYPGRPDALRLDRWDTAKKVTFPSVDKLSDTNTRGQVLHFFANHELLAIELMALVLLKFPEAPENFRKGIVDTIFEEQEHMRLYAGHMDAMGVSFGEIPVNDFFWTCLSPMTSLLDFVAHMSLTFEQANLDFSLHFAKAFRKVGDVAGATILDKVFKDEIGHVKHGLVWLNRWKDVNESDWDAYVRSLRFPITPNRAKGLSYGVDLRRDIGFSEQFIGELSVFTHTKGRPPFVHYYNPSVEHEVSGLPMSASEQKVAVTIESDLASLMMFLARHDDLILVRKKPSQRFLLSLKRIGVAVPEFAVNRIENGELKIDFDFEHKNLGNILPWANSESVRTLFSKMPALTRAAQDDLQSLKFKKEWFSKVYLYERLNEKNRQLLCVGGTDEIFSEKVETVEAALQVIKEFFKTHGRVVIKEPYSSSGRQRLLVETHSDPRLQPWLVKTIAKNRAVIVEPWLDKICDLSLQLFIRSDETIDIVGWTRFLTDTRGQYLGTVVGRPFENLSSDVKKMFYKTGSPQSLEQWQATASEVAQLYANDGYRGPLGVDAFVYRNKGERIDQPENPASSLSLRSVVEVNPRFTMGRVALEISKLVLPGQFAIWMLLRVQDIQKGFATTTAFRDHVENKWPVETSGQHIRRGVLLTTDITQAELFVTILCVGRDVFEEISLETTICEKHLRAFSQV